MTRGRRLAIALAAPALLSATWPGAAPARSPAPAVPPTQPTAKLLKPHVAYARPTRSSARLQLLQARRPLTRGRTVLPVVGRRTGAGGVAWLRVRLPGRPNGRTGWIVERWTVGSTTAWHVVVRTSARLVTVYRLGRPVRSFSVVVGKPSTPTPLGRFFVEEAVQLRARDVGGPFALALSARSNVLQRFAGGPGQVALHGRLNVGGVLGTAVSHGCVRLANEATRWLVMRIGPGAPVTIVR